MHVDNLHCTLIIFAHQYELSEDLELFVKINLKFCKFEKLEVFMCLVQRNLK